MKSLTTLHKDMFNNYRKTKGNKTNVNQFSSNFILN